MNVKPELGHAGDERSLGKDSIERQPKWGGRSKKKQQWGDIFEMRLREPGAFKRSRKKKEAGHYYNGVIAACASGEAGAVSKVDAWCWWL